MTNSNVWTRMVLTAALAGGLLFTFGGSACADSQKDCKRRLNRIDREMTAMGAVMASTAVKRITTSSRWMKLGNGAGIVNRIGTTPASMSVFTFAPNRFQSPGYASAEGG